MKHSRFFLFYILGLFTLVIQGCGPFRFFHDPGLISPEAFGYLGAPNEVDFNGVRIQDNAELEFTIQNRTVVPQTLNLDLIEKDTFSILTSTCQDKELKPQDSCTVKLKFLPTKEGQELTNLVVKGLRVEKSIAIKGRGFFALSVDPTEFSFGQVRFQETSPLKTFLIKNAAKYPITLQEIKVEEPFRADPSAVCTVVPAQGQCEIKLSFFARDPNPFETKVEITDGREKLDLKLDGQGFNALKILSANPLHFGQALINTIKKANLQIQNLSAEEISLTFSSFPSPFTKANSCNRIAALATCNLEVSFSPLEERLYTGEITITSGMEVQKVTLRGNGVRGLRATPEIDFQIVKLNTNETQTVSLSNSSNQPLVISSVTLQMPGGKPSDLSYALGSCSNLGAKATCNMNVTYRPTQEFELAPNTKLVFVTSNGERVETLVKGRGYDVSKALLSFGVLSSNMACVMCHMKVSGDVSGFGSLTFRADSFGEFKGNIYAADIKKQKWVASSAGTPVLDSTYRDPLSDDHVALFKSVFPASYFPTSIVFDSLLGKDVIKPGEIHNNLGSSLSVSGGYFSMTHTDPANQAVAKSKVVMNPLTDKPIITESDFPTLDPVACKSKATGRIQYAGGSISGSVTGNVVLMHGARLTPPISTSTIPNRQYDLSCPANKTITVDGEVVIDGDLVLAGCITGRGTIYATGNIYIPDDIKLVKSPYPFPDSTDDTVLKNAATAAISNGKDMVSLGAGKFIVIGAIDSLAQRVLNNSELEGAFGANWAEISNINTWLAGSPTWSASLYSSNFLKLALPVRILRPDNDPNPTGGIPGDAWTGAVSLVEANLYANKGVTGPFTSHRSTNIVINGSVLTPKLGLLNLGFFFKFVQNDGTVMVDNPFNGRTLAQSELNQDYRLKYSRLGYECQRDR